VREVETQRLVALRNALAVVGQVVAGDAGASETARRVGAQLLAVAPVGALVTVCKYFLSLTKTQRKI